MDYFQKLMHLYFETVASKTDCSHEAPILAPKKYFVT